jgi:hypothetical protein
MWEKAAVTCLIDVLSQNFSERNDEIISLSSRHLGWESNPQSIRYEAEYLPHDVLTQLDATVC